MNKENIYLSDRVCRLENLVDAMRKDTYKPVHRVKCIVKGCVNHTDEGEFIGDMCGPCHTTITTGVVCTSRSFICRLAEMVDSLTLRNNKLEKMLFNFGAHPNHIIVRNVCDLSSVKL